ncbi:MAG: asparagine synthetase B, partial [Phycisphaerales bacterium]
MCGIAGIIKIHDPKDAPPPPPLEAIPEHWLDILDESIKHRGPDGQGRFRDRATREDGTIVDVALVHRRLSIIDHAGGYQPMVHDGERLRPDLTYQPGETPIVASEVEPGKPLVAVVFNGCIYNHRELRAELEGQGCVFDTDHSDTEVLVHGWRHNHVRMRHQLDGMYGVAIWDRNSATLTGIRDDFGQKPLYRSTRWHNLDVMSSNPVGLLTLAAANHEICDNNPGQTRGWIKYGWNQAAKILGVAESMLPGISTAIPSNEQDDDGWAHVHHLLLNAEQHELSVGDLDDLLRRAVQTELEADVSIGCFLSGGIDSALLCHYATELNADITAYTVRMPSASFDESHAASETAQHLGIRHRILDCDPNPSEDLVRLIEQLGLPFGDSSLLPTHWVCRAARREVKVALAGDGGDELFLGYDRHRVLSLIHKLSTTSLASLAAKALPVGRVPKSRVTRASRLLNAAAGEGYKELVAVFPSPFDEQLGLSIKPMDHWGLTRGLTPVDGISLRFDRMFYLPEDILRKTDTASM